MPDAERDSASPSCSCVPDFPVVLRLLEFFSMRALRVPPDTYSLHSYYAFYSFIRVLLQSVYKHLYFH